MTYQVLHLPRAILSTALQLLPGWKIRLYLTGTTTPTPAYETSALDPLAVHTQPVVADAGGVLKEIYLDPSIVYKCSVYNAADVLQYTVDPVNDQILSQSVIGALLWARTQPEIDATVTPSVYGYPPFDPRRYASLADWSAVYAQISTLDGSYEGWYRGDRALHSALTNCIVGYLAYDDSQKTGTIGYRCTAIGALALHDNKDSVTAGGTNTAIGYAALEHCVECSGNTAVGVFALNSITGVNSSHNNAFGYRVLPSLVSGTQNNAFGFQVLDLLTDGNNNHGFGENALSHLVKGQGNHVFGYQALYTTPGGNFAHAFGYQCLFNQNAAVVTAITKAAGAVVTISTVSTINPFSAGQYVTLSGIGGMAEIEGLIGLVTAIGGSSGAWTITTDIDSSAFTTYTSGGYLAPAGNAAYGYRAGLNVSMRGGMSLFGHDVCASAEPGYGNSVFGFQAGKVLNCNTGSGDGAELNSLFGHWSGRAITSGSHNCNYGDRSGQNITTGSENVSVGANSSDGVTTADNNVNVGSNTSVNLNGNNNTSVGFNAGTQVSAQTYTNSASFGANAVPTGSNQVTLGDSGIATLRCQQTSITALSDERYKQNVAALDIPDAFLEEVGIVTFDWIASENRPGKQFGVIAQQLDELQNRYDLQWLGLVDKSNPDRWEATPGKLLFPLIAYSQRQSRRLASIEERLAALEAR